MTDTLLAERELPGYPGCNVQLHVKGSQMLVMYNTPTGTTKLSPKDKAEAKDMYFHPFVYGLEINLSTATEDDGA